MRRFLNGVFGVNPATAWLVVIGTMVSIALVGRFLSRWL